MVQKGVCFLHQHCPAHHYSCGQSLRSGAAQSARLASQAHQPVMPLFRITLFPVTLSNGWRMYSPCLCHPVEPFLHQRLVFLPHVMSGPPPILPSASELQVQCLYRYLYQWHHLLLTTLLACAPHQRLPTLLRQHWYPGHPPPSPAIPLSWTIQGHRVPPLMGQRLQ